jgi:hypothetical protein
LVSPRRSNRCSNRSAAAIQIINLPLRRFLLKPVAASAEAISLGIATPVITYFPDIR